MSRINSINEKLSGYGSLNESKTVAMPNAKDVKAGTRVVFKEGTPYAKMDAFVVQTHPERNTVDLKFGKSTRMDVPVSDLEMVEDGASLAPVSSGQAASATA